MTNKGYSVHPSYVEIFSKKTIEYIKSKNTTIVMSILVPSEKELDIDILDINYIRSVQFDNVMDDLSYLFRV